MKTVKTVLFSCALASGMAGAVGFPEPIEGTITIGGTDTVTYDCPLPTAAKLVKTGSGEAILTVDTDAFSGDVDVREGTLKLTTLGALGVGSAISVTGTAATLHLYEPDRPAGCGQRTSFFGGHNLTISGAGVDGKGAFQYTGKGENVDDSMLDSLSLSGNATISFHTRCGVGGPINLNGHVLTYAGESIFWMFFTTTKINAGKIVVAKGGIFIQSVPEFTDPENTLVEVRGGSLRPRNLTRPFDCPLLLTMGTIQPDAGEGEVMNVFSRPVTIAPEVVDAVSLSSEAGRSLNFTGSMELQGKLTIGGGRGKVLLQGPITGGQDIDCVGYQTLVCTSNVSRTLSMLRISRQGPVVHMGGGTMNVGQLRLGNAEGRGMLYQTGGTLTNADGDSARIGEQNGTHGILWLKNGTCDFKREMHVGKSAGSVGMIIQEGGVFRNSKSQPFELGEGGKGYLVVSGGTNDTVQGAITTDANGVKMSSAGGLSVLTVSGRGVLRTSNFQMGVWTAVTTNIVNVVAGGTIEACRFRAIPGRPAGSLAVVNVDGGVLKPTWAWGWNGQGGAETDRNAEHFVVHQGGVVIDTSDTLVDATTYAGCQFSNQLEPPHGKRIKSISLPDDANFAKEVYYGPVPVDIEGSAASYGAAAYATFDVSTGVLSGVVVMSGGCDYDANTRIYIASADGKSRYACAYELEDNPLGGGLTKRGAQELQLYGRAMYDGATVVEEGLLTAKNSSSLPQDRPLAVKSGASLMLSDPLRVTTLELSGTVGGKGLSVSDVIEISAMELFEGTGLRKVEKELTLGGDVKLKVRDPENLKHYRDYGPKIFLTAEGGINGDIRQIVTSDGVLSGWKVRKIAGKSWSFGPEQGLIVVVR